MSIVRFWPTLTLAALFVAATASAQPQPAPGRRGQAGAGGGPPVRGLAGAGFNARNKKDQLIAIKDLLKVNDEEWAGLSPKVDRVITAKMNTSTGAGMNFQSANNMKPSFHASNSTPDSDAGRAMQAVREAVADEAASDEQLAKTMADVRAAKRKARAEYDAAQEELLAATTPRQQAVLMTLGVVE
jgi:hypothetical protein